MGEMARDLVTKVDCVAIDHWRDVFISHDDTAAACAPVPLLTLELGSRSDQRIRRCLERQIDPDRRTRSIRRSRETARHDGVIDMRPQFHV